MSLTSNQYVYEDCGCNDDIAFDIEVQGQGQFGFTLIVLKLHDIQA